MTGAFDAEVFDLRGGEVWAGELRLADLAEKWSTPLYVLDLDRVDAALATIRRHVDHPSVEVFYAVKAYANIALLEALRERGIGLDVCSPGEVEFGLAAGYGPRSMSYLGVGLSTSELEYVADAGVFFTADSVDQLRRYGVLATRRDVGLRVNPGIPVPTIHPSLRAGASKDRFGIEHGEIEDAVRAARAVGLQVTALHAHLGSDLLAERWHVELMDRFLALAERIESIEIINLGGGYGVPFTPKDERYPWEALGRTIRNRLSSVDRPLRVRLEPGTFLVRSAGYLLTQVTDVKRKDGCIQLMTDTGTHQLVGPALYGARHPVVVVSGSDVEPRQPVTIYGNLMVGGDVLAEHVELPPVAVGHLLVFGLVGAYGAVRASNFNQRVRPAEVLVGGASARLVRRRRGSDELLCDQVSASGATEKAASTVMAPRDRVSEEL